MSSYREVSRFGEAKRAELDATAQVLAAAVSDAVASRDQATALQALNAIGRIPSVRFAEIRDTDGNVFAQAGNGVALIPDANTNAAREPSAWRVLTNRSFSASAPIIKGGVNQGTLTLLVDTSELLVRFWQALLAAVGSAVAAILLGLLIAARMQREITRPISELTGTMNEVRLTSDFTHRAARHSDDETGQLVDAFNDMLDQVQNRDVALADHRAGLERTVADRTRELAVARDTAEDANRAKSDFLATMSHEIRTPLNGMLVMAELLARDKLPAAQQRYADIISRSGQTLLSIINDILDLSKIEAGKLTLEKARVSPASIIGDALGLFWERAASKGIDLAGIVAPGTPLEIEGDPVRLSQVVSNLLNNALKFTERGHVLVEVEATGSGPVRELEFRVIDTGIGIASDKLGQVFEAFGQADVSTTRRFGGTGLGLSISQRLVGAMGGRIWVESAPNEGSRFSFTIQAPVLMDAEPAQKIRSKRVVVSVDGFATRQAIASAAQSIGYQVKPWPTPIRRTEEVEADVIVVDASLAKQISIGGQPASTPIVILSSLGDPEPSGADAPDAMVHRLVKPIISTDAARFFLDMETAPSESKPSAKRASVEKGPDMGHLRVLVADDSRVNQEVARAALKALGVTCGLAADGAIAIKAWRDGGYDVVLMDCGMPVVDGYAATREIRRIEEEAGRARTPIVALTADVMSASTAWKEAGMDAFLSKPFTLAALSECLSQFVKAERRASADPAVDSARRAPDRSGQDETVPPFDPDVLQGLRQLAGNSDAMVWTILKTYLAHVPARFEALEEAFGAGDMERIATEAHALKSPSGNVGANVLAGLCQNIEKRARARDPSLLQDSILHATRSELLRVVEAAEHMVETPRNTALTAA